MSDATPTPPTDPADASAPRERRVATLTLSDNPDGSFSLVMHYHGAPDGQSAAHRAAYLLSQHLDTLGERCVMSQAQADAALFAAVEHTQPTSTATQ